MKQELTYFASDFHLGAKYIGDPKRHERAIVDWLRSIAPTCRRLFLVGDILDYWYEYKSVVPKGFVRFFGQLAEMADSGVEITWFIGNHDIWIFDYLPSELGIKVVKDSLTETIDGTEFFISHGDGLGRLSTGFRFLRGLFRNRFCQRLYSAIHPGLTVPFAHRWSASSRMSRTGEYDNRGGNGEDCATARLREWAEEKARADKELRYIVVGHYHEMIDEKIAEDCQLIVLGDWIDKFSYAVFDGKELKLKKYN